LAQATRRWPILCITVVLIQVGSALGSLFFLFPGLWVATSLAVAPCIVAVENEGMDQSFRQSLARMKGSRIAYFWAVFSVSFIMLGAIALFSLVYEVIAQALLPSMSDAAYELVTGGMTFVWVAAFYPWAALPMAAVGAVTYLKVTSWEEDEDEEEDGEAQSSSPLM
jgi:hypothetical protein